MAVAEDLPLDLIVEILARLPVKPLLRFKTVCKTFYCIISHLHFILHDHLEQSLSSDASQLIAINHGTHIITTTVGSAAAGETTRFDLTPFFSRPREVSIVGSCHGFLALSNFRCLHISTDVSTILLNPSTLSHFILPCPDLAADTRYGSVGLGFGYDSYDDDYKFVFVYHKGVDNYVGEKTRERTSMVYSFKYNRWGDGSVDVVGEEETFSGNGTLVDEVSTLHWLSWRRGPKNGGKQPILCFDLCSEEWSDLAVIEGMLDAGIDTVGFGCLGVLDGCLCLAKDVFPNYDCSDIWVMEEYGVKESWIRWFRICGEAELFRSPPLAYSKGGGEVLVVLRKDKENGLFWCNWGEDTVREADEIPENSGFLNAVICVGSLFTIPMLKWLLESNQYQWEQSQNRPCECVVKSQTS